jgi:hypothetical protein
MEPNRKELLAKARAKGALYMQHVFLYVFYFVSSTNIYLEATGNGIQGNNSGLEPDDPNIYDDEQDLLKAELQKIHDLEDRTLENDNEDMGHLD